MRTNPASIFSKPAVTALGRKANLSEDEELAALKVLMSLLRSLGVEGTRAPASVAILGEAVGHTRNWKGKIVGHPRVMGRFGGAILRLLDPDLRIRVRSEAADILRQADQLLPPPGEARARLQESGGLPSLLRQVAPALEQLEFSSRDMKVCAKSGNRYFRPE